MFFSQCRARGINEVILPLRSNGVISVVKPLSFSKPIPQSYWVQPGYFLAGEHPGHYDEYIARQRISAFLRAGFTDFIDLTQPYEPVNYEPILKQLAQINNVEITYNRMPIEDQGIPTQATMIDILDTIDSKLSRDRKVYVHCWGGVGRTGTVVGCYLVHHGMAGAQALSQIRDWWKEVPKHIYHPNSPETPEQIQFILDWKIHRSS